MGLTSLSLQVYAARRTMPSVSSDRGGMKRFARDCRPKPVFALRHVLTQLPQRADDADITDLLPFNFSKTAAA